MLVLGRVAFVRQPIQSVIFSVQSVRLQSEPYLSDEAQTLVGLGLRPGRSGELSAENGQRRPDA